ncbi:MAG: AAA family ATPase, partial [Hyphomicrobiales bacterium]|nr:AAA family ATPase [Hyphomicrobiales bacterium]
MADGDAGDGRAGERRQITVAFCDIVGSSALAGALDPEDFSGVIVRYRRAVAAEIEAHGGFVSRYVGDGVLAYWGFPRAHEHDPLRAIAAALAVVRRYPELGGPDGVRVRFGIETGVVVVGGFGAEATQGADIVGEAPNVAAHLQVQGGPGEILVTDTVRRLAQRDYTFEPLGPRRIKASGTPVEIFKVIGRAPFLKRLEVDGSRLFGRESEVAALEEAWRQAAAGDGGAVVIAGEPGIGKSALVAHLRRAALAEGAWWLDAECQEEGAETPLLPIRELVMRAVGLDPLDPSEARLERLGDNFQALGMDRTGAPALSALLGIASPPLRGGDETFEQRRLGYRRLEEWLEAIARHGHLVAVVENVHWADEVTKRVLAASMAKISRRGILLVVTTRGRADDAWLDGPRIGLLRVGRLPERAIERIVDALDGGHALDRGARRLIVAKSEGIPLFAVELAKLALGAGGPALLERPSTLNDSLASRLDALGPLRPIAQAAAVIGDYFDARVLASTLSISPEEIGAKLAAIAAMGIVETHDDRMRDGHSFSHALLREAALNSLLRSRRRDLHGRVARVLVAEFPQKAEARPDVVAQHFAEGGDAAEAGAWWRRAGDRAARQFAPEEAIAFYGRALGALAASPEGEASRRLERSVRLRLAAQFGALRGQGSPAAIEQLSLAAATARPGEPDDDDDLFLVHVTLHWAQLQAGRPDEAAEAVRRLLALAGEDAERRAVALRARGLCELMSGGLAPAAAAYSAAAAA